MNEEEYDEKCNEIQEKIIEVTDRYSDYISEVSITWKKFEEKNKREYNAHHQKMPIKTNEQSIDLWEESRMLHRPNDYEDGV